MATMKEVAERSGVSVTTVSHVINHTRFVSEEVMKRVEKAIGELDYKPDQVARSLRKGKSETIGVIVSDIVNPFFPQVVRGIEDCSRENGYSTVLCNTDEDPSAEELYISLLRAKRVDGFIVAPSTAGAETLSPLIQQNVPLVLIDRRFDELDVDQVFSNNLEAAYKATNHLISLGHTAIGIIVEIIGIRSFDDRLAGWKVALEEAEIEIDETLIRQAGLEIEGAYEATKKLLTSKKGVSAIFSTNNLMTSGVLRYLKEKKIECPSQISLVGFDDPEWAASVNPSLTSVAQQPYEMGYKAAEFLLKRIEGDNSPQAQVCLECELRVRESSTVLEQG